MLALCNKLGHNSETAMRVPTMTDLNTVPARVATLLVENKILSYIGEAIFEVSLLTSQPAGQHAS